MAYKLYDENQQEVTHHDLQDKGVWCINGATKEEAFVQKYGSTLNLIINPHKVTNPYVPDLYNVSTKCLGDLKTQNTPFFQAQKRFALDPQYVVVFNHKDRMRYRELYPTLELYFAVDWQVVRFEGKESIQVKPMIGVWKISFSHLDQLCENAPQHYYHQRQNDRKGNAKGSYVLDLRRYYFTKVI